MQKAQKEMVLLSIDLSAVIIKAFPNFVYVFAFYHVVNSL
jgi:hypothetical protein